MTSLPECAPDCQERAECPEVGTPGHTTCGTCPEHDRPVHHCLAACWPEPVPTLSRPVVRTLMMSQLRACPILSLDPTHYREDGTCLC